MRPAPSLVTTSPRRAGRAEAREGRAGESERTSRPHAGEEASAAAASRRAPAPTRVKPRAAPWPRPLPRRRPRRPRPRPRASASPAARGLTRVSDSPMRPAHVRREASGPSGAAPSRLNSGLELGPRPTRQRRRASAMEGARRCAGASQLKHGPAVPDTCHPTRSTPNQKVQVAAVHKWPPSISGRRP